jgi:hypothetical protein
MAVAVMAGVLGLKLYLTAKMGMAKNHKSKKSELCLRNYAQ